MKIDRATFLALTATLAIGCSASSGDESVANDQSAVSAGGSQLCYSADESHSFEARDLSFDPARDFPAAEGFCFDIAETAGTDARGYATLDDAMYERCNAYAKTYVPLVATNAYRKLRPAERPGMPTWEKRALFDAVDAEIASRDIFCQTPSDRIVCRDALDQRACLRLSTQLVPAAKERLAECLRSHEADVCTQSTVLRP